MQNLRSLAFVVLVAPLTLSAQEPLDASARAELFRTASKGWELAQQAIPGSRYRIRQQYISGGKVETDSVSVVHVQPRRHFLIPFPEDGSGSLHAGNDDYRFELIRGAQKGTYLLKSFQLRAKDTDPRVYLYPAGGALLELGYSFWGIPLDVWADLPQVVWDDTVTRTRNDDGEEIVRLTCEVVGKADGWVCDFLRGQAMQIELLPASSWLIHRVVFFKSKADLDAGRPPTVENRMTYIPAQNGSFLLSRWLHEVHLGFRETVDGTVTVLGPSSVPEEQFRLPYYGISEASVGFEPPTNWVRWILIVSGIVIFAVAVFWLRRTG